MSKLDKIKAQSGLVRATMVNDRRAIVMVGTKVNVEAAELLLQQERDFELRRQNLHQTTEQLRRCATFFF